MKNKTPTLNVSLLIKKGWSLRSVSPRIIKVTDTTGTTYLVVTRANTGGWPKAGDIPVDTVIYPET